MKINLRWMVLAGWLAGLLGLAGCGTLGQYGTSDSHTLRVGVAPDYPPVIFMQDGRVVGLEADLARELAARLGMKLVFVQMEWDKLADGLVDGRVDIIMSGMSITQARRVRFDFATPYLQIGQMALVRTVDAARYSSQPKIMAANARVGVQTGTTGDQFVEQYFPNAKKYTFLNARDAAISLTRNRVDLVIHDAPVVWWLASEFESVLRTINVPLTEEQLAWGIRRDNARLMQAANQALAAWEEDGTLDRIMARWIPYAK